MVIMGSQKGHMQQTALVTSKYFQNNGFTSHVPGLQASTTMPSYISFKYWNILICGLQVSFVTLLGSVPQTAIIADRIKASLLILPTHFVAFIFFFIFQKINFNFRENSTTLKWENQVTTEIIKRSSLNLSVRSQLSSNGY